MTSIPSGPTRPRAATARTKTSLAGRAAARHGFTLLELLVVLVVLSLLLVFAAPRIDAVLPGAELRRSARDIAAGLRLARSRAILRNREISAVLDVNARRFYVEGERHSLAIPGTAEIALVTAASERLDEARGRIRFFPDGGSTGGRVRLGPEDGDYRVDVDWLTGQVTIAGRER